MAARGEYERPWKRIAADLRAKIMDGRFRPGERLPTIADLQREYIEDGKLRAKNTVRGALAQLLDEGLIESRSRSYYVREDISVTEPAPSISPWSRRS